MSENTIETTPKNVIDVSGLYKGGEIRTLAKKNIKISEIYLQILLSWEEK